MPRKKPSAPDEPKKSPAGRRGAGRQDAAAEPGGQAARATPEAPGAADPEAAGTAAAPGARQAAAAPPGSDGPAADPARPDEPGEPDDERLSERFARVTAPKQLDDPVKRAKWGLPRLDQPNEYGPYIIELNAEHIEGLPRADKRFLELYAQVTAARPGEPGPDKPRPRLRKIAKSYYRCHLREAEWRALVRMDEQGDLRHRAVYRLWPDFPVEAHTDRSMSTIKADAALRSFAAAGDKIVWAVVDSGIDQHHPHFGDPARPSAHLLLAEEVRGLHRCFADPVEELPDGRFRVLEALEDPDQPEDPPEGAGEPDPERRAQLREQRRRQMLEQHHRHALRDDFGHGTHVAGIIAGQAPRGPAAEVLAFEREYRVSEQGKKAAQAFTGRRFEAEPAGASGALAEGPMPRGVAPRCKLISLRVLDHAGKGRASQVIEALEYIRDRINDNPKVMRVHGVNLSVGYEFDAEMFACGQSPLCAAVDRLVQEGVVVVAAAGNTGFGVVEAAVGTSRVGLSNTINDPGNAALAITVGATHRDSPHTYGVSYFSSKGPTADGRLKPDLVAPGERITSCAAGKKLRDASKVLLGAPAGAPAAGGAHADPAGVPARRTAYYVDDSGTSMAAPHVSGAVAAFLSIRREFIGKPLEVKRIFLESATPLGRERYFEGHGMVDLMRAIQLV